MYIALCIYADGRIVLDVSFPLTLHSHQKRWIWHCIRDVNLEWVSLGGFRKLIRRKATGGIKRIRVLGVYRERRELEISRIYIRWPLIIRVGKTGLVRSGVTGLHGSATAWLRGRTAIDIKARMRLPAMRFPLDTISSIAPSLRIFFAFRQSVSSLQPPVRNSGGGAFRGGKG